MAPTNSTKLMEWTDPPRPGRSADEWPYPTRHVKYIISGELADRVRKRFNVEHDTPVIMTEDQISGGYSEYTQETDFNHQIDCGGYTVQLYSNGWSRDNGLTSLLAWLDEADEDL